MLYDPSWKDPLSWLAIVIPIVFFAGIVIGLWEVAKWIFS